MSDMLWLAWLWAALFAIAVAVAVLLSGCGGDRFNKYQHPLCEHNRSACR